MIRTINVHEAKTHLSRLLDDVRAGEEIILAKAGEPYARLVPITGGGPREFGFLPEVAAVADAVLVPLDDVELDLYEAPR
jgi:prevent-host-death family protein